MALVALGALGCHKSQNPVAPSAPLVTGTWTGTGLFLAEDTLTFVVQQSGTSLTGTWSEGVGGPRGTLAGSSTGSTVSITFSLLDSTSCPFPVQIDGVLNGNRISGTYKTVTGYCVGSSFKSDGTGTWTRQ